MEFYNKETELVLEELQTTVEGLTEQEVKERQERDGFNELKSKTKFQLGKYYWTLLKIRWLLSC